MEKSLTAKQRLILATIQDLRLKLGKSPTLKELANTLGYAGISSVQRHIAALKKKGFLTNDSYQHRSLEVILSKKAFNIPLIGQVAAGTPILSVENIEAYIQYEPIKYKFNPENYFFLRALGDSMNQYFIHGKSIENGDYVLVRSQNVAEPGQIVVALIGDDATIKKLEKGEDCYILRPQSSNPNNKAIYIFDDLIIQGIVVDVVKKGGVQR